MGLNHSFIYINPDKYTDDIWKKIHYNPLRLENELISEFDFVKIHDNLLRYFHDYFVWIKLYNPCKKEYVNGFCYYGITTIYGDALSQMRNILYGLFSIFENAPDMVRLRGDYLIDNVDEGVVMQNIYMGGEECDGRKTSEGCKPNLVNGYYNKIYIEKNKIIDIFNKLNRLIDNAIEKGGYVLHHGI
jgi:hypothetical protein